MANEIVEQEEVECSFCGKPQLQVKGIVAGSGVYIYNKCVDLSRKIVGDELKTDPTKKAKDLPESMEIKKRLDEYAIGQGRAREVLSVAVYSHYERINRMDIDSSGTELQESDTALVRPAGSSKTYLTQALAKILDVPLAITDATTLTKAGYIGKDVENILLKLLQNADYDLERAQRGIIYVDETDKISRKAENVSVTRNASGEGVQQSLLKILEGTIASVPPQDGRRHLQRRMIKINITNTLFIVGGAFDGIENIVKNRLGEKTIGFGAENGLSQVDADDWRRDLTTGDLVKSGLIPESIGRIPIITTLDKLSTGDLIRILTEPKDTLVKQYKKLLSPDNVDSEFAEDAFKAITNMATSRHMGARGLRSIAENPLMDVMYRTPNEDNIERIEITKDVITKRTQPEITHEENESQEAGETAK